MVMFVSQGSFARSDKLRRLIKRFFVGIASRSVRNFPSGGASFYGPAESS
jgi:hypothetical protein